MENGEEKAKTNDAVTTNEVTEDKPASEAENQSETKKTDEPPAELLEKIKNQVEFYFGDVNMPRDKFLIERTKWDEGWIPMNVMLNFKMLASMSKEVEVILKALETSELIEISEDKRKIRRTPKIPLPVYGQEYRKAQEARTVHVLGFPLSGITIEKLTSFFSAYESFEKIIMRRDVNTYGIVRFNGSISVQFKTLDDAKAFMARESVEYRGTELIRKWSFYIVTLEAPETRDTLNLYSVH